MSYRLLTPAQVNRRMGWPKKDLKAYWDAKAQQCTEMGDEGECLARVARHVPITIAGLGSTAPVRPLAIAIPGYSRAIAIPGYSQPDYSRYGMGDLLNDALCSRPEYAAGWQRQLRSAVSQGRVAAAVGGAAAGLIGGLSKRPLIGALFGAGLGYAAHAIWTAPFAAT